MNPELSSSPGPGRRLHPHITIPGTARPREAPAPSLQVHSNSGSSAAIPCLVLSKLILDLSWGPWVTWGGALDPYLQGVDRSELPNQQVLLSMAF